MDQQSPCPNFQGHHGDPLEKLLFPLKLALQRKHPDECFPPYEPNDSKNTLVADLEGRRKENFRSYLQSLHLWEKAEHLQKPKSRGKPKNVEKLLFLSLPLK